MKTLITGIEGFVGPHLAKLLTQKGYDVYGTYFLDVEEKRHNYFMDITDAANVNAVVQKVNPESIFHLAGFSSVGLSFQHPEQCKKINVEGTKNLLEAVKKGTQTAKILIISSADVYGVPEYIPIDEAHPVKPRSPYAESRIQQELICQQYMQKWNLPIIITRSFNHIGPGQTERFVIANFVSQLVKAKKVGAEKINVGNLDVIRDFTDVRDTVKAYYNLSQWGKINEIYNVCSGIGYKLNDLLKTIMELIGIQVEINVSADLVRSTDIPTLIGDNTKIKQQCKWIPEIKIEQTLQDIIAYFQNQNR